ncbi:DUF211 domain-containing protein [Candidatus Woesearchaeota archaeon]|nr:DUF211 domain-containing protein [Candidatus Woesearchaeota archaeon]
MIKVNLLILDILKPHQPNILEFGKEIINSMEGVSINLRVVEIDEKTESVELVAVGDIDFEELKKHIESLGASIHSIDEVSVGREMINSQKYLNVGK